jgi:hypothetical protein
MSECQQLWRAARAVISSTQSTLYLKRGHVCHIHTANEACLQNRKKDKTGSLGYNPTKFSELKIHQSIVEVRYAARNTTVLHVINNGTLQNPFCLDVLDRFLTKYGHIDVAVFMKPHGGAFNTYTRLKAAGKDVGDWKPVDLSTMTSEGAQVPIADLAKILGGHADHLVYVEPWNMPSGTSNSKDPAKADRESKMQVENDATASAITDMVGPIFNLNDYVWARLGAETPYRGGMCVSGMGHSQCGNTSGHQCQPGALTVAAVALNRRVHTLMGRQWPEPILLQQSNPVRHARMALDASARLHSFVRGGLIVVCVILTWIIKLFAARAPTTAGSARDVVIGVIGCDDA